MGMKMAMEKEEIRPWDEWEGRRHPPWMCVPRFPMGESSNSFLTLFSSVKKILIIFSLFSHGFEIGRGCGCGSLSTEISMT